jgi:hypothetical protein
LRHSSEGGAVKLARRGLRESRSRLLRPSDATAARKDPVQSQDFTRQEPLSRPCQEAADPRAVGLIGMTERVRQHHCALPFPQIAIDLAVATDVTDEIEDIVGDLERDAEQKAESVEPIEARVVGVRDQRANAHRMDEPVPGGLLEHEPEVTLSVDTKITQPSSVACPSRVSTSM